MKAGAFASMVTRIDNYTKPVYNMPIPARMSGEVNL